ncbi:hypothetical protein D3C85_1352910 [compost metagenome]
MLEQCFLDDRRIDVVPSADDQILGTAGEKEETTTIAARQIASLQPAIGEEQVAIGSFVQVAGEHRGAADHQLADGFIRTVTQITSLTVQCHYLDLDSR